MKSYPERKRLFAGYNTLLQQWNWEWLVTLTFPPRYRAAKTNTINRLWENWMMELEHGEGLELGGVCMACYNFGAHPHLHALLLGRGSKGDSIKTLQDVDRSVWSSRWRFFSKVESPKSIAAVAHYLASHCFYGKCSVFRFDSYNPRFLNRVRIQVDACHK